MAAKSPSKPAAGLSDLMIGPDHMCIWRRLWPLFVAVLTTGGALAIDYSIGTFATEATDALYILAASASAFSGRWRYGLLSVALGILPNIWISNSPHYSLAIGVYGWEHVVVTTIIAAALALLVSRLRSEQDALKCLNDELEDRVEKRTADLEESNRQLEAFCYTLSHDLRAPLRAIQGFSQITVAEYSERIGSETTETLARISNSAEMMGRLITDLLSYTQLHRAEIPLAETNLQEVLDRTLQILDPAIREKHAIIEVTPLPSVTSNFVLTEQIFLNLISNALKFNRDGVTPHIRIWPETLHSTVQINIHDNGPGIAPQHMSRIFAPFQRLSLEKTMGTGIGLALAKKGVERLGGKIGVDSHPNQGSCFWIELPR